MKYVVILPDGAADEPLAQLDGRTPLEAAKIPNMDAVAQRGHLGRVVTVPKGFTPGTDVATLSLLGYDPYTHYSGRAPIEAAAQGLEAGPDELIFRCNFVTILDGLMKDFTAGHIAQAETDRLIADLNLFFARDPCRFYSGVSYRNLMITPGAGSMDVKCQPPHDIPNQPIAEHGPRGTGADRLMEIANRARRLLADHDVNRARRAKGVDPVTDIWLWGHGRPVEMEPFVVRFGLTGAVITGVDILRGLAVSLGLNLIAVPGATGYLDTNYEGKGAAALEALNHYDIVIVHIEAPDEAGHLGDATAKVESLERIDKVIVGPLLEALQTGGPWRMLIAPDHPTPVSTKAHSAVPPLYCFAGSDIPAMNGSPFGESAAAQKELLDPGHKLMSLFLGKE
jgi:2,3-bisphosphoglycerate-independent phosphoglycerate mutase